MSRPIFKRQDIHEAAMRLFVEKGIEGTTTREIAQAAKAGEGTMFRHYKSKEDLAWHLYHENLTSFMAKVEESVAKAGTTKLKIRSMIADCYHLYETNPVLCSFLLLAEHSAAKRMGEDYKTPTSLLVSVIEEGRGKGEVRPMDPQLAAALVLGAAIRVPLFKYYKRLKGDLREVVDEVTEAVWQMIQP
jgi:AcrR family transcriptional regulator